MKRNRWFAGLLCFMLMGCTLAEETGQKAPDQKGSIIGFMVASQDQMTGTDRYDASCKEETNDNYVCSFDTIDGYMAIFTYPSDDEGNSYGFKDENMSVLVGETDYYVTDEEDMITTERSLNIIAENHEDSILFKMMPIYFDHGEIYVTNEGSGLWITRNKIGYQASQSGIYETIVNGTSEEVNVTVRFHIMYKPEMILIHYMDQNNQVIQSIRYEAENVEDEIHIPSETAYLIIETRSRNFEDQLISNRQIIDRDHETMTTYYAYDDIVCDSKTTTLIWE